MSLFRRAIRWLLLILGLIAGLTVAVIAFFTRLLVSPPRTELWATPADLGLLYEDVLFPARDGLRLSGWFIPTQKAVAGTAPTIVLVHGWPWNRLGSAGNDLLSDVIGSRPVDLLRLAHAFHHAGHHLLMFDLRNHGRSAAAAPVTFGLKESYDLLGALDYLAGRREVNQEHVYAIGFSMGANTVLYSLPHTDRIRAAVLVQPTSISPFARRYSLDLLGPLSAVVLPIVERIYQTVGGLSFAAIEPIFAAAGLGETPVLYVQGKGDRWGSVENVAQMAAATPRGQTLFLETRHRFEGYQHIVNNPEVAISFFRNNMAIGR